MFATIAEHQEAVNNVVRDGACIAQCPQCGLQLLVTDPHDLRCAQQTHRCVVTHYTDPALPLVLSASFARMLDSFTSTTQH